MNRKATLRWIEAPRFSKIAVLGAPGVVAHQVNPDCTDDPQSPHYLGREISYAHSDPRLCQTEAEALAELLFRGGCFARRKMRDADGREYVEC